jgi:hypothetical protein
MGKKLAFWERLPGPVRFALDIGRIWLGLKGLGMLWVIAGGMLPVIGVGLTTLPLSVKIPIGIFGFSVAAATVGHVRAWWKLRRVLSGWEPGSFFETYGAQRTLLLWEAVSLWAEQCPPSRYFNKGKTIVFSEKVRPLWEMLRAAQKSGELKTEGVTDEGHIILRRDELVRYAKVKGLYPHFLFPDKPLAGAKANLKPINYANEDQLNEWPIYQVAFLWHGKAPLTVMEHWNLMTREIGDTKKMLHDAVDAGKLRITRVEYYPSGFTRYVSRAELRRLCATQGYVPAFLFPEKR